MQTVAIVSQKGGAGKTTLALHLATAAHAAGIVSLILDADPQATASRWSQWRDGAEPDVIDCASPPLLAKKLDQAAELGAELAVIDTPPHADSMSAAACRVADLILVPCRPRAFDLDAIQTTADLVKASGKPGFVVFMAGPQRAIHLYKEAAEIVAGFGLAIAPVVLSERAAYHHATGAGKTAQELEPGGRAAEEVAALWAWVRQRGNVLTRKHVSKEAAA
ncbi:ParA family partition ATPase [Caulobacter sp. CCH5-E12]|uniref:ParA family partition ATPase n=1 Tax=Caulobacter sp. CCH5-E12 TaxID=1768770 RepID=UPI0007844689|nr:ParA family partition ATPase [Caulobacter sp. CCH5-E12]